MAVSSTALLADQPLFKDLSADERDALLKHVRQRTYHDGAILFARGDTSTFLVAPQTGRIRITLISEEGREILLNLVTPGQICGEYAFLDGGTRSANAIADGECTVATLDRADILPVFRDHPELAFKLLGQMTRLLRHSTDLIETLVLLPLPARLARVLLRMAEQYGVKQQNDIAIISALTQGDYAQLIAATRESVNKQLRQWQMQGTLTLQKDGTIIVHDMAFLRIEAGSA